MSDDSAPSADLDTLPADAAAPAPVAAPRRLPEVDRARYRVEVEIARGGLGRVLRARDVHLDRPVALKEMLVEGGDGERRFVREALITARLEHPSIVPVHDAGHDLGGAPFYAMKLVRGRPLGAVIAEAGSLARRIALVPTVVAIADAIAYAHSEGVIHRDLKPGNVLVGDFGETVVIDWGLAKDLRDREGEVEPGGATSGDPLDGATVAGAVLGTPAYMAPEQAAGEPTDERADVYALGAILYEVLSGAAPHRGTTLAEVLQRTIRGDIEPLTARDPAIPGDLAAIVAKAMARAPADRYRDAGELAADLRRFVAGKLVGVYTYSWRERLARWIARHRAAVAVGAVAAIVLAVVATVTIRQVVIERDEARRARAIADTRAGEARAAQRDAVDRADDAILARARDLLDVDQTAAVAVLAGLSERSSRWSAARVLFADARARGISEVLATQLHDSAAVVTDDTGNRVATVIGRELRIWDRRAHTVRVIALAETCANAIVCQPENYDLALSPHGRWVAASQEGEVELWDVDDPATPSRKVAGGAVRIPDDTGTLIVDRWNGTDPLGYEVIRIAPDGAEEVLVRRGYMTLSRDGAAVVADTPEAVSVWRDGKMLRWERPRGSQLGGGYAIAPAGDAIAWTEWTADRGEILIWALDDPGPRRYALEQAQRILVFSQDGRTLRGYGTEDIEEIDVASMSGETRRDLPLRVFEGVPLEGDGTALAGFEIVLDRPRARVMLLADAMYWRLAADRGGAVLVGRGADVRVWSQAPARPSITKRPLPPARIQVTSGYDVVVSEDGGTMLLDWAQPDLRWPTRSEVWTRSGVELRRAGELPFGASNAHLSADGRHVVTIADERALLYPIAGGTPRDLGPARDAWFGKGAVYTAAVVEDGVAIHRWPIGGGAGEVACAIAREWSGFDVSDDGDTIVEERGARRCRLPTGALDEPAGAAELRSRELGADGNRIAGYDLDAHRLVLLRDGVRRELPLADAPTEIELDRDGRRVLAIAAGGLTIWTPDDGGQRSVRFRDDAIVDVVAGTGDRAVVKTNRGALHLVDLGSGVSRQLGYGTDPRFFDDGVIVARGGDQVELWADDLPAEPGPLRAAILGATNARVDGDGNLVLAEPFREIR